MDKFLKYLIRPLLSQPDELHISVTVGNISVTVDSSDAGRVIGKHGQVVNALRTLLKTYCILHRLPPTSVNLQVPPVLKSG